MTPARAGEALAAARIAAGLGAWLLPGVASQLFGATGARSTPLPLALRLFGSRDVVMGLGYLYASGRPERNRWLALGIGVDAADAAASVLAGVRGAVPRRAWVPAVLTAAGAVALGRRALRG